jgi:hypothetical protein
MVLSVALLVMLFADPATRPKAAPATNEAAAEMLASWNARLRTLWTKNEGIGAREERVTFRAWSEKDKRFGDPVERVEARRIDRSSGGTTFVLSGTQVTGGRPPAGSEITDKDGAVWVVGAVEESDGAYSCSVRKK